MAGDLMPGDSEQRSYQSRTHFWSALQPHVILDKGKSDDNSTALLAVEWNLYCRPSSTELQEEATDMEDEC